jgi:hypothetical protein
MSHSLDMDAGRAPLGPHADGLAARLEGLIARKASGRIRDLLVVCEAGHITIKGRTRTHHARQLALQAVLDTTDGRAVLADQIVVS